MAKIEGDGKFDNADLAMRISLIARIVAQFTQELAFGMHNPFFYADDPGEAADRFLEAIEPHLKKIKARQGRLWHS